HEEAVSVDRVL
nr:Chain C, 11-mer peptide from S-methyl-5'-thioadenosine phosphorylase [Homo sapiens]